MQRRARLTVHDLQGRRVVTLADRALEPGRYSVIWGGRAASGSLGSAGVYFVRLVVEGEKCAETRSRRVVMTR